MGTNDKKNEFVDNSLNNVGTIKWWAITFVTVMVILMGALFASAMIPQRAMHDNLLSSAEYYAGFSSREMAVENVVQSRRDIFADAILMNIIACTDSENPVEATVKSEYYVNNEEKSFMGTYFLEAVNGAEGNNYYSRYWHGSLIFLRLLMLFTDAQGIEILNVIILVALSLALLIACWKTNNKRVGIAYIIGFIVTSSYYAALSIEYMPSYIIALLGSIAALKIKEPKYEVILFTLLGISTAFFDFLTTETMTAIMPLLCLLVVKNNNIHLTFKEGFKISFKLLMIWAVSYAFCYFNKWLLSALVLGNVGIQEIFTMGLDKFNGIFKTNINAPLPIAALFYNVAFLIPTNIATDYSTLSMVFVLSIVVLIAAFVSYKGDAKCYKDMGKLFLCAGILPILRIMILANHSYMHSYFTYRALISTVMCIVLFYSYVMESKKGYAHVKAKTKSRKGHKR